MWVSEKGCGRGGNRGWEAARHRPPLHGLQTPSVGPGSRRVRPRDDRRPTMAGDSEPTGSRLGTGDVRLNAPRWVPFPGRRTKCLSAAASPHGRHRPTATTSPSSLFGPFPAPPTPRDGGGPSPGIPSHTARQPAGRGPQEGGACALSTPGLPPAEAQPPCLHPGSRQPKRSRSAPCADRARSGRDR